MASRFWSQDQPGEVARVGCVGGGGGGTPTLREDSEGKVIPLFLRWCSRRGRGKKETVRRRGEGLGKEDVVKSVIQNNFERKEEDENRSRE